ncbi:molybdenum cofactor guanylyltransferase [Erythrobacter sp.]|uniref:molybdenum cofactor guanylyltransferase n=1 Tax=Erythrobacter sp. TaxID=1042 RepID=UPI00311E4B9B
MTKTRPAIIIAAGGGGTRMGGDKPSRKLAGKPLLEYALEWAMDNSDKVAIAVQAKEQVSVHTVPILCDKVPGIGPIGALDSAFRFSEQHDRERVMLIGCDLPLLPSDLVPTLEKRIGVEGCAMPVSQGRDHPLAALWQVECKRLAGYIAGGGRSLWRFSEFVGVVRVDWGQDFSPDPFANINEPTALAEAERWLAP